ncbi:MAG TPA: hypothetical protein VGV64_05160, partial [Thermoplasmata archaeon]|nr:hypothetical protein [Thermoplasmata archaeon]
MKPLLLTSWDTSLKVREGRKLVIETSEGRKSWLPIEFPYDTVIVENLGGFVTFPALRWLALNGVTVTALDFGGRVLASYLPDAPQNHSA